MNRLLRAIENVRHKVIITAEEKPRTVAFIDGQQIPFSLWESSRRRDHLATAGQVETVARSRRLSAINPEDSWRN